MMGILPTINIEKMILQDKKYTIISYMHLELMK